VFHKHRAEREAEREAAKYQAALSNWQTQHDRYANLIEVAEGFDGSSTDEIMLKPEEALFYEVTNCALVEERRGKGTYEGGSTGVSIPIGSLGGRSVRYRVGASRGHYVQGAPVATRSTPAPPTSPTSGWSSPAATRRASVSSPR
jgi:hypothetical protein